MRKKMEFYRIHQENKERKEMIREIEIKKQQSFVIPSQNSSLNDKAIGVFLTIVSFLIKNLRI